MFNYTFNCIKTERFSVTQNHWHTHVTFYKPEDSYIQDLNAHIYKIFLSRRVFLQFFFFFTFYCKCYTEIVNCNIILSNIKFLLRQLL